MNMLGPHLAGILSEVSQKHYDSEEKYLQAVDLEYNKILAENRAKMSPDDMELLSSTRVVLSWSYPVQK